MQMFETALGRLVHDYEHQTVLEDAILSVLFTYRMHPQNPNNVPMKLGTLVQAVNAEPAYVVAALDGLKELKPPLVEESDKFQTERTFRITGAGVRFVRSVPQGLASVL
jgi:hypothetical protein